MTVQFDALEWHDIREFGIEGRGWDDTLRFYDRLPQRAQGVVPPPVWDLSRHSAGMLTRFEADSPILAARWDLLSPSLAMDHMPASGVSGLDLYADDNGRWRWAALGRATKQSNEWPLLEGLEPATRRFMLYLPLYNGVESVRVGIERGASLRPLPARTRKPIVFYGTSIVHGGCASRPGMAHPAILGRRLDSPVINLGFSGNGRSEPEVAELLSELDAAAFVIDPLPNMTPEQVAQRMVPLVRILRRRHARTPIVLVEDRTFTNAWLLPQRMKDHAARRAHLRAAFEQLRSEGLDPIEYLPADNLLGDDEEATVDSSHPTDVGFVRMADALEPVLRKVLRAE